MSATFKVVGNQTQVDASWIASTPKMQNTVGFFAQQQFDRGQGDHGTEEEPRTFDDLSWQEKLDIWFDYVTTMSLNDSKAYRLELSNKATREIEASGSDDFGFE